MNLNINLEGYVEEIISNAVERGIAKTKAEAIRQAILLFGKEYGLKEPSLEEVLLVREKGKQELADIEARGEKWYSLDELKKELGHENAKL